MDDIHRRIIKNNKQRLVEITNYYEMRKLLLKKKVFTDVMINNIETEIEDEHKRLDRLYDKLTKRGPLAFNKLLEIFEEEKNKEAYNLLTSSTVSAQTFTCPAVIEENRFLSLRETSNLNRQNSLNTSISPNNDIRMKNDLNYINNNVSSKEEDSREATDGMGQSKKAKLKLQPFEKETFFQLEPNVEVKRAANFGTHPKLPVYSMKSRRRGVLFFVNIINFENAKTNRNGAHRDRENLVTLFREINFTVFYYEDLTKIQLLDLLNQLINSTYIKNIDAFFLCIQTHGDLYDNQTIMEFSDGTREATENVIAMFSNVLCPALVGKPKVFFFPFCRGKISDRLSNVYVPIETDGKTSNELSQISVPKFSDILICYGTIPGFMTHRDIEFGSWYVRELCKVFADHAYDCHIEDMLKLVGANTMMYQETEGRTQVASVESRGFNKLLFLNPKIYD